MYLLSFYEMIYFLSQKLDYVTFSTVVAMVKVMSLSQLFSMISYLLGESDSPL